MSSRHLLPKMVTVEPVIVHSWLAAPGTQSSISTTALLALLAAVRHLELENEGWMTWFDLGARVTRAEAETIKDKAARMENREVNIMEE